MNNQVLTNPTEIAADVAETALQIEAEIMIDNVETYGLDTEDKMELWMSKHGYGVSEAAYEVAAASTLLTDING